MAITATQSKAPASVINVAVGSYITSSTAEAFVITTGFKPRFVEVHNETSGDSFKWYEGMTNAEALKRVAAGTSSIITSNGITVSDTGFTVGLDTDVNVINEQLSWICMN